MKYLIKALVHEFGNLLLLAVLICLVGGFVKLVVFLAGDYSVFVLLVLLCVCIQGRIIWERAQVLKRRNEK